MNGQANNITLAINIAPNERQKLFFQAKEKFLFYGGAKGGGKSWAIRWKQILRRLKYPKSRGLLLRRTYPELYRTHIEKILQELPKDSYKYNAQTHTITFPNESTLEMGSCQYEQDVLAYQGSEFDDIGVDEATQFSEYQFNILKSILRTTRPDLQTQMYLGANPGGVGHGWVRRVFIDQELPDHKFIPAKIFDNPVLMQADPEYVKSLEQLPDHLRRMYLEGDWDIFEGQVFNEWRRDKHVITQLNYPLKLCKKVIGFDWGYAAPGCAIWIAITPENQQGVSRAFVYRELYQNKKAPEEWAQAIKSFTSVEPVDYLVLPHDCYVKEGRESIAGVFRRIIGIAQRPARTLQKDARKNRVAITHNYLAEAADGKPQLQVHINCKNLIRTLPELIYSQSNPEDVDTDGEDHAYDALSIALMTHLQHTLESGPVKAEAKSQIDKLRFPVDEKGEIIGFDLDKFKEEMKYPQKRSWEYS